MKRYRIAALLLTALALPACTPKAEPIDGGGGLRSWTDPDTGCAYLIARQYRSTAITPRLDADGLPDCPGSIAMQSPVAGDGL
jgi:hypothetical protein